MVRFVVRLFFVLWGWVALGLPRPTVLLGAVWFFVLGCFLVCFGMGGAVFCPIGYVGGMLGGMG